MFGIGVLHVLPKCAANGVVSIVFCFDVLNRCTIACSHCSKLSFSFNCVFIHDSCRLIV